MSSDELPKSVWQGTFRLFGVDVACHVLSDGRRIIEGDSIQNLFEAMATTEDELDAGELEAFARWQQGGPGR